MEEESQVTDAVSATIIPEFYTYNISAGRKYLSQLDNSLRPMSTCNTTSMIMALTYSGVALPPKEATEQYEDILTFFILNNPEVSAYYKKIDPINYGKWAANPKSTSVLQPNEYHAVLAYATNLWLKRKDVVQFTTETTIKDILYQIVKGKAVVISGVWAGLRHVTCAVGLKTKQDLTFISSPEDIDLSRVSSVLMDDPYGNFATHYIEKNGDDIEVALRIFINSTRTLGKETGKWAHYIEKI